MVAQNYRYSRPAQTLKRVLASGELGPVGAVSVSFFRGPHFGGFREAMPYPLVVDMAIHHFDMLRFFLGADPIGLVGRSWNPPWSWFRGDASTSLIIDFPGNVVASYRGSWCAQGGDMPWNGQWRFDCAAGIVELRDDRVWTQRTGEARQEAALVDMPLTGQAYLLHDFVAAIRTGVPPATNCFDNIKSLQVVFDAVDAFERQKAKSAGA
jgi:predicted dehydrogenase